MKDISSGNTSGWVRGPTTPPPQKSGFPFSLFPGGGEGAPRLSARPRPQPRHCVGFFQRGGRGRRRGVRAVRSQRLGNQDINQRSEPMGIRGLLLDPPPPGGRGGRGLAWRLLAGSSQFDPTPGNLLKDGEKKTGAFGAKQKRLIKYYIPNWAINIFLTEGGN